MELLPYGRDIPRANATSHLLWPDAHRVHHLRQRSLSSLLEPDELRALVRSFEKLIRFMDEQPV